jgi:hypothetical protein
MVLINDLSDSLIMLRMRERRNFLRDHDDITIVTINCRNECF